MQLPRRMGWAQGKDSPSVVPLRSKSNGSVRDAGTLRTDSKQDLPPSPVATPGSGNKSPLPLHSNAILSSLRNPKEFPSGSPCYIMNPMTRGQEVWAVVMSLAILFTMIVTPFEVAFLSSTPHADGLFVVNRILDILFLADIINNLLLARFDTKAGMWRVSLLSIATHYAAGWLAVDLITTFPFDLIAVTRHSKDLHFIRILRCLRVLKLGDAIRKLETSFFVLRMFRCKAPSYNVRDIIKLVLGATMMGHWMACLFRLVVEIENVNGHSEDWISNYFLEPSLIARSDVFSCYVTSAYWAVYTMATVGYGDVVPKTNGERIVASLCMLVGVAAFAYILGTITGLIANLDPESAEHRELMDTLQAFIKDSTMPLELQKSLESYFIQCRKLRKERRFASLLSEMSPELRGRVLHHTYDKWLSVVPFFQLKTDHLPATDAFLASTEFKGFVLSLANYVSPMLFVPFEVVMRANQFCTALYIVKDGLAACNGKVFRAGRYFGQEMLLTDYNLPHSITSLTYLHAFRIDRTDLMKLLDSDMFPRMRYWIRRWTMKYIIWYKFPQAIKQAVVINTLWPKFNQRLAVHTLEEMPLDGQRTPTLVASPRSSTLLLGMSPVHASRPSPLLRMPPTQAEIDADTLSESIAQIKAHTAILEAALAAKIRRPTDAAHSKP